MNSAFKKYIKPIYQYRVIPDTNYLKLNGFSIKEYDSVNYVIEYSEGYESCLLDIRLSLITRKWKTVEAYTYTFYKSNLFKSRYMLYYQNKKKVTIYYL